MSPIPISGINIDDETKKGDLSLDALKSGDPEELSRFVEAYSKPVYRIALRMLGDPSRAEDILQETFIKAIKALPGFEGRSSFSTWLFRIATNEALMVLRKKQPDVVSIDEEREDEEGIKDPIQLTDWCCMPEDELSNQETRDYLAKAMLRLSPALRTVFELRDIEGLSVKETSEVMKVSESVVKTRLLRARLQLREELSSYFGERMKGG